MVRDVIHHRSTGSPYIRAFYRVCDAPRCILDSSATVVTSNGSVDGNYCSKHAEERLMKLTVESISDNLLSQLRTALDEAFKPRGNKMR